ncbi:flagellar motor switch phosphatase FliY [Aquibacillus sediminis]|uniref:flagellar motor switch phosphatase FliY n=1 Tax=Aquibacillus sediminis TaxID=2574734 RepID=UPI001109255C|nr:flagellar motor switch phosphatase FliY [Aquibacillus sediminis]
MNDGMLSQEEIDALLKSTEEDDPSLEQNEAVTELNTDDYLTTIEQDALGEIGNISFGSSATTLSTLLNQKVDITTPKTAIIEQNKLSEKFPQPHVGLEVKYTEGFSGTNLFVLQTKDAAIIADLMLGGNGEVTSDELTDISLSAVQEAMNQMMGTAATSMSTVFNKRVDISPPTASLMDNVESKINHLPEEDVLVEVSFQLKIGNLIDSHIMQLLPVSFAKSLVNELMGSPAEESVQSNTADSFQESPKQVEKQYQQMSEKQTHQMHQQTTMQAQEQPKQEPKHIGATSAPDSQVQTAAFSSFSDEQLPTKEKRNLDMLLDIPLNVTVELGRTQKSVKDILEMSSGSIIELDKLAGEPVDIHVNNKLIAKGEVVVIEENFGVRVTDIVSQSDRLKKLN